jgi:hypothetical protein
VGEQVSHWYCADEDTPTVRSGQKKLWMAMALTGEGNSRSRTLISHDGFVRVMFYSRRGIRVGQGGKRGGKQERLSQKGSEQSVVCAEKVSFSSACRARGGTGAACVQIERLAASLERSGPAKET